MIDALVTYVAYFVAVAALTLAWFGVGEWLLRRRDRRRLYVVRGEVVSLDAHRAQRRGGTAA